MTTVANGCCTSAPAEVDIAIGKKPNTSVKAVSKIGLILRLAPSRIRSFRSGHYLLLLIHSTRLLVPSHLIRLRQTAQ